MQSIQIKRIVEARKRKGISQRQIAQLLNTTQQQISKYEKELQELPLRHFIEIGTFLNLSLDYLAGINNIEKPPKK